ncbi:MAG: hypothetical protein U5K55_08735 [Aliarcobacter sp.]|nr:hypothetical protein [Aliarcobacter sp.]
MKMKNFGKRIAVFFMVSIVFCGSLWGGSVSDALGSITDLSNAYKISKSASNKENVKEAYTDIVIATAGTVGNVLDKVGGDFVSKGNQLLKKGSEMNTLAKRAESLLQKYPKNFFK